MPNYSNITVVAVLDNNGELHKINYEQLANLPSSMKNPHALIIFGQRYDGSNETTIIPTLATSTQRGCVMPTTKTAEMTQEVGIDSSGKLYTRGLTVDQVVTAFSTNPVSSDGVRNYVTNNNTQIYQVIQATKEELKKTSNTRYNELRGGLTDVSGSVDSLKKSTSSSISELQTSIKTANDNIEKNKANIDLLNKSTSTLSSRIDENDKNTSLNKQDISELKPKVTQLQTDIQEVKSRNIGYYFDTESALLSWLSIEDNVAKLGVGVCLYIRGNPLIHYVWNGTSAEKVNILADVVGGYMTAINPTGTGYIRMNNNQVASDGAAFGADNIANGLYSFVAGHGMRLVNECQAGIGKYNAESKSDEIFTVGYGKDDNNRKTVSYIGSDGTSHHIGDVTACDEDLSAPVTVDVSRMRVVCAIKDMPVNVKPVIDWSEFLSTVTLNNVAEYTFVYNDNHWNSSSYDFSYIIDQQMKYNPISAIGITFDYIDGRIAEVPIDFVDGDTITVYAPLQKTISLRELYNAVNATGLYVDEDGDVCQED